MNKAEDIDKFDSASDDTGSADKLDQIADENARSSLVEALLEVKPAEPVILLFDEADALFGKRSSVKDSHDRYADS